MIRGETSARGASIETQTALVTAAAVLAAVGSVAVFSATAPFDLERTVPPHFLRHATALGAGAVIAFAAARLPLRWWHGAAWWTWGLCVLLLAATVVWGLLAGGARRWLFVPGLGMSFQPGELARFATVLVVARVLARREGRAEVAPRRFTAALALAAVPAGLSLLQPDFGGAVILFGLTGLLLFVAGAPLRHLVGPAVVGAVGVAAWSLLHPYALRRWVAFLDPWARPQSEGFQLVQSFVAFGTGGLLGVGPGNGRQQLFYLPEAHTDFILAVVAEELGLVGVLIVLGAFAALLVAGVRIALSRRQRFPMFLAFGMTALLAVPAALNAAVVMGLAPTKGLTLPLLSYGRTSLVMACLALGVILGVARAPRSDDGGRRE